MSLVLPPVPPVSAGLGGTQPANPPGMSGLSPADAATNAAIQAIVGPSYKGYENYKRGQAYGMTTASNLYQTAAIDRPPEPVQFIHEQLAPGLEALLAYFEIKSIDPTDKLIKTVALVFNASRWPRITDLTQGDQDMHSSFRSEAATVQIGKMGEIDIKALNTALGRRMWYERLKQASNGLLNTIMHFAINALLGCAPDKLAKTANGNFIAPYTARMSFVQAVNLYIGQFNVIGKGPYGVNDLTSILQTIQAARDNSRYEALITDVGFINRLTRTMSSWTLESLVHSIVGIPAVSETKSFLMKHVNLSRVLETGPVATGPNNVKSAPFTRNAMVATHQIVPCTAANIRLFDRRLDQWIEVSAADLAVAGVVHDLSGAALDDVCSYIFFTLYQVQTSSAAFLDTNRQRPELHMSTVTSATTIGGDQLKLGFYAAMTIAAVVPDKNAVLFMNDIVLRNIMRGGGLFADSVVTGANPFSLRDHRTRICVRVRTADIAGLVGDRNILSLFGHFPVAMTNTATAIDTWRSNAAGTAEVRMQALCGGKPVNVAGQFAPESVINGQIAFPWLSTRDACIYEDAAGNTRAIQPKGIFGNHAYEGCTGDSMGSLGSAGYLRPYSADIIRMNNP